MTSSTLLGCDLQTLRNKFVITNSRALSNRILEGHSHFGAQAHSIESFVRYLHTHSAKEISSGGRDEITSEELDFFGEDLKEKLPAGNYFKTAFDLSGLRAKVFESLDELRIAGYEPKTLSSDGMDNPAKIDSLREIFAAYTAYISSKKSIDYSIILREIINVLQSGVLDSLLSGADILIPFTLDLKGMESSFVEILRERAKVYTPTDTAESYLVSTDIGSASLERFKTGLASFLERTPLPAPKGKQAFDPSLYIRSALTRDAALAEALQWMLGLGATVTETGLVTPDYDGYAGSLYRLSLRHGIPINLSRGLLVSEFAFFSDTMAQLESIANKCLRTGKPELFMKRALSQISAARIDHPAFESFQRQALGGIQRYLDARSHFESLNLPAPHAWEYLRNELLQVRVTTSDLDLDRNGLFFGAPSDLLGCRVKHLAILGLQDHQYPPKVIPNAILPDSERIQLNEKVEQSKLVHELRLSAPLEIQKDLLEKLCLGVSHALYLSYESHDLETGRLSLPSSFLNRVLTTFGYEQKSECIYEISGLPDGFFQRSTSENVFFEYDAYLAGKEQVGSTFKHWPETVARRKHSDLNEEDGITGLKTTPALIDGSYSASAIADFFTCPYKFYLKKVLDIEPLESSGEDNLQWLDAMQWGTLIHFVFEKIVQAFLSEAPTAKRWKSFLKDEAPGLLPSVVQEAEAMFKAEQNGVPRVVIDEELALIQSIAVEFIRREQLLLEKTGFYPLRVEDAFKELSFSWHDPNDSSKKLALNFHGRVDRLDTDGKGQFRVLDYKTGKNRYRDESNLYLDGGEYVHFQHAIYGLWAMTIPDSSGNPPILSTGYYFTSDKSDWEVVAAPYTQQLPAFEKTMSVFHAALSNGQFHKNHKSCGSCDFRLACGGIPEQRKYLSGPSAQLESLSRSLIAEEVSE